MSGRRIRDGRVDAVGPVGEVPPYTDERRVEGRVL